MSSIALKWVVYDTENSKKFVPWKISWMYVAHRWGILQGERGWIGVTIGKIFVLDCFMFQGICSVCLHNKHGFCKFGQPCRKLHIYEICLANNCEIPTLTNSHPKSCSFYQLYQWCKFGIYCAFMHCESMQSKEIELLKVKVKILEKWRMRG